MLKTLLTSSVLFIFASAAAASEERATIPKTLRICGDEDEWPPFTMFQQIDGKRTRAVAGFNVQFLNELLANSGYTATFTLLPWKRCLAKSYNGEYDIVMDGVKSPEREKHFLFPPSHYQLTTILLHRSNWPKPDFTDPDSWSKVNLCAQSGWAYDSATQKRFSKIRVDLTAKTFEAVVQMILMGRCDAVVYNLETLMNYPKINRLQVLSDNRLTYSDFNFSAPNKSRFYLMVSRHVPYQEELLQLLNKGIANMNSSGRTEKLLKTYMPD